MHDRYGVGKETYATKCVGCEGNERNGKRPLRSCSVKPCGCMDMERRGSEGG